MYHLLNTNNPSKSKATLKAGGKEWTLCGKKVTESSGRKLCVQCEEKNTQRRKVIEHYRKFEPKAEYKQATNKKGN